MSTPRDYPKDDIFKRLLIYFNEMVYQIQK